MVVYKHVERYIAREIKGLGSTGLGFGVFGIRA